jgi:hypothetical protein
MVSAKGSLRTEGFDRYCLDNGAWWAFKSGSSFDGDAFLKAYEMLGEKADFVVLPDIVGGGMRSLEFSLDWLDRLGQSPSFKLLAVQDGMPIDVIRPMVGPALGIFVGGTTEWKESMIIPLGMVARERSCWLHVGRVNTARRIHLCAAAGATSFDGSSVSRFVATLPGLDRARRQADLFAKGGEQ